MHGYLLVYYKDKILLGRKKCYGWDGYIHNNPGQLTLPGGHASNLDGIIREFKEETNYSNINKENVKFFTNSYFCFGIYKATEYDYNSINLKPKSREFDYLLWKPLDEAIKLMKNKVNNPNNNCNYKSYLDNVEKKRRLFRGLDREKKYIYPFFSTHNNKKQSEITMAGRDLIKNREKSKYFQDFAISFDNIVSERSEVDWYHYILLRLF